MKGIIMSGPGSVQAIIDRRKWQTRRLIKEKPVTKHRLKDGVFVPFEAVTPRYQPGELVYVKERFTTYRMDTPEESAAKMAAAEKVKSLEDLYAWSDLPGRSGEEKVMYAADYGDWADDPDCDFLWTPARQMGEKHARIILKIESVRAERVQDISEEDAIAEGVEPLVISGTAGYDDQCASARDAYYRLFLKINPKASLSDWVWVYEFRVAEVRS